MFTCPYCEKRVKSKHVADGYFFCPIERQNCLAAFDREYGINKRKYLVAVMHAIVKGKSPDDALVETPLKGADIEGFPPSAVSAWVNLQVGFNRTVTIEGGAMSVLYPSIGMPRWKREGKATATK